MSEPNYIEMADILMPAISKEALFFDLVP